MYLDFSDLQNNSVFPHQERTILSNKPNCWLTSFRDMRLGNTGASMLNYQSQLTSNADCTLDLSSGQGEKWSFWHCDTWWKLWGCTCTALASKAKGDGDSIKMLIYYTASQILELWKWWHDICFNINHSARHFVYLDLHSCEAVQRQEEQKDLEILRIQQPNPLRWN